MRSEVRMVTVLMLLAIFFAVVTFSGCASPYRGIQKINYGEHSDEVQD